MRNAIHPVVLEEFRGPTSHADEDVESRIVGGTAIAAIGLRHFLVKVQMQETVFPRSSREPREFRQAEIQSDVILR